MTNTVWQQLANYENDLSTKRLVARAQNVEVDLDANLARVGSRRVLMPPKELQLLYFLVTNAGQVVRREVLLERMWATGRSSNKGLDVHIRRLRQRIEPDPTNPRYIRTARGTGYIFDIFEE